MKKKNIALMAGSALLLLYFLKSKKQVSQPPSEEVKTIMAELNQPLGTFTLNWPSL